VASNLGNKNQVPYAGVGLALGAAIGFVFGMMLWPNYFFIGAVVGAAIGLLIGAGADAHRKKGA
jgi:uncharacterized membrane protein